jgi:hypothetical protein
MAVLGHRTPNMSIIYSTLSDPAVKQQYQDALGRHLGPDVTLAGPRRRSPAGTSPRSRGGVLAADQFPQDRARTRPLPADPAEGPCECDLVLTCSKFLTTSDYTPRLRARLDVEQQIIDDATARGWQREIERHTATKTRIEQLLKDLRQ